MLLSDYISCGLMIQQTPCSPAENDDGDNPLESLESNDDFLPLENNLEPIIKDSSVKKRPAGRGYKPFRPIILCILFLLMLSFAYAQFEGAISLQGTYSDNVFQLSDYDFTRYDEKHPNLDYVKTTDDLSLGTRIDLAYPLRYRWWKFIPSISATLSQNLSNHDKYRRDILGRMRVERYYWNATLLYGYYPNLYVRDYVDTDGTKQLENYGYERNLYRGDLQIKPLKNTTLKLGALYENLYYNKHWTEFDADATTLSIGARYRFPIFTFDADYKFRELESKDKSYGNDSSYQSDNLNFGITLNKMPLIKTSEHNIYWRPALDLSYEDRFYQGADSWYGGREDKIYNTSASLSFDLSKKLNINLDYTHLFRSVASPNDSVVRLKEYNENRVGTTIKYSF